MSIFAYLSGGKNNSSERLREALKMDALRARFDAVDSGVKTSKPGNPGTPAGIEEYDPVLRSHCRFDK